MCLQAVTTITLVLPPEENSTPASFLEQRRACKSKSGRVDAGAGVDVVDESGFCVSMKFESKGWIAGLSGGL